MAETVLPPYHRHGDGLDLVPGAPEGCIDPGGDPNLVLAFTPDALARYVEGHVANALREVAADLKRNHDMPPNKDRRNYGFRMGWWDGVHHAAKVVERAASENPTPPAPIGGDQ